MKILFLCNKSPWPPREGGPMAMNMFIEGLLAKGHEVKVLAVNSWKYNITRNNIPESYLQKTGLELIDVDLRIKAPDAFLNLFTSRSYHVQRFISGQFSKRLTEVLQRGQYDVVQLETLFMCPYIPVIRSHSDALVIFRAHNIEHRIWQRIAGETRNPLKKWYLRHLAKTLRIYEESAITTVDGIVPITANDGVWFREKVAEKIPVEAIPFGMNVGQPPEPSDGNAVPSLFSIGSMNWIPNQEGIRWFLKEVWPDVHHHFPGLHYYIAGREMPAWMRELEIPNVHILGEVEDAGEFISQHTVMIVPLFSGSGIRIKIIEGMAAGKTVISTTLGAEGIEYTRQENILLADRPCEFFEMISICINNQERREKTGLNARKLILEHYHPEKLIERLTGFYYFCRSKTDS